MVKKQEEDWTTFDTSNDSYSNVRKYLDLCKDWLVSHDMLHPTSLQYCNIMPKLDIHSPNTLGVYETDLRKSMQFSCYICKESMKLEEGGKKVVANPFTRAQYLLVCNNCYSEFAK